MLAARLNELEDWISEALSAQLARSLRRRFQHAGGDVLYKCALISATLLRIDRREAVQRFAHLFTVRYFAILSLRLRRDVVHHDVIAAHRFADFNCCIQLFHKFLSLIASNVLSAVLLNAIIVRSKVFAQVNVVFMPNVYL